MRASALEPVDKSSGYNYKNQLGYYQSIRDASVNFFIDNLPKGSYTLEYKLYVTHEGTFNNGIASIQCMYSPEFTAHTGSMILK